MLRDIVLTPTRSYTTTPSAVNPATSPYPWLGSGSIQVHEAWSDKAYAEEDPTSSDTWVYSWNAHGAEHLVGYEPGPTLSIFTKVTFVLKMDYFQTGPNNWWFPPDNAFGPGLQFTMVGRDGSTRLFGPHYYIGMSTPVDLTAFDDYNSRPSKGTGWHLTPELSWELTSHPEGGPFTLEDINALQAGYQSRFYNGPNGKPYDETQGSFFKLRIPWLKTILTVQDLGGYIRSVRHNTSNTLRLFRKSRNTIHLTLPAERATKEVGEVVNIAHDRGPGSAGEGWGHAALERRSAFLVERTYWPEDVKVQDTAYDLHDYSCEMWGAFRIPIAWTPELSGLAYLDRGGEFTMTRAQDAWSLRPGDGAALRVLEDYPNLNEDGLALHSTNGTEMVPYNANLLVANGWTEATTGGASFSDQTLLPMADELGYSDSVLLTFGGSTGTGDRSRTISLSSGDTASIRVRVRNISNDDTVTKFLEVAFYEGGNYWNEATRSWDASPVYNQIPADQGGFGEFVADQIPISTTTTYTIKVGRMSSAINTCSFVLGLVSVQKNAHGTGMPLVTLASTIARTADVWDMDNASPYTFWHRDRGMVIAEFRPFWRAASLAAATSKPIIRADHTGGAFDELRFVAGSTDQFVAERFDGSGSQTISINVLDSADATLHITRAHYVRVFWRWLDDSGWRQYGPNEILLGYAVYLADGTFVSYHETTATWTAPDAETEDTVTLTDLDGWMRWLEVKRNPLSGTEAAWRR